MQQVVQTGLFLAIMITINDAVPSGGKFGAIGPRLNVEEIEGYPDAATFFTWYAQKNRPIKMTGAGKQSPAFTLWSDEYFLSLDVPEDDMVVVEAKKKENRSELSMDMHFQEFVRVYNATDQYMVQNIPPYLAKDVILPKPLQCPQVAEEMLSEAVVWFSSGGTKSVVHTDSVDNIICVYRGVKEFVMVDPHKYGHVVVLDRPDGAFSTVDVDNVDYEVYPGLAKAEYYHVTLQAGDCMYVPYKWVHQVRSYESNIAVNVWWDAHKTHHVDADLCPDSFDLEMTLDKVDFASYGKLSLSPDMIRGHFSDFIRSSPDGLTMEHLISMLLRDIESRFGTVSEVYQEYLANIHKVFSMLDVNTDGVISLEELEAASYEDLTKIAGELEALQAQSAQPDGEEDGYDLPEGHHKDMKPETWQGQKQVGGSPDDLQQGHSSHLDDQTESDDFVDPDKNDQEQDLEHLEHIISQGHSSHLEGQTKRDDYVDTDDDLSFDDLEVTYKGHSERIKEPAYKQTQDDDVGVPDVNIAAHKATRGVYSDEDMDVTNSKDEL